MSSPSPLLIKKYTDAKGYELMYQKMEPMFRSLAFEKWFQELMFDYRQQMMLCNENLMRSQMKSPLFQRLCSLLEEFSQFALIHFEQFLQYENYGPYHEGMRWDYNNHLIHVVCQFMVQSVVQCVQTFYQQMYRSGYDYFDENNMKKLVSGLYFTFAFLFRLENEYDEHRIRKQSRCFPYLTHRYSEWYEIEMNEDYLSIVCYDPVVTKEFLEKFASLQRKYKRIILLDSISAGENHAPMTLEELDLSEISVISPSGSVSGSPTHNHHSLSYSDSEAETQEETEYDSDDHLRHSITDTDEESTESAEPEDTTFAMFHW